VWIPALRLDGLGEKTFRIPDVGFRIVGFRVPPRGVEVLAACRGL